MNLKNPLINALGINAPNSSELKIIAKKLQISVKELNYYNSNNILPNESVLKIIESEYGISKNVLMIKMGIYDINLKQIISTNYNKIIEFLDTKSESSQVFEEKFRTKSGTLFKGDCISYLKNVENEKYDLIFADPPFNLDKFYLSEMDDNLSNLEYIKWTETWLNECIRTLKKGGSLFIWNLPKWNTYFAEFLNNRLFFKHWIATDIKFSLPISGKLYPSHYSLLYYIKGDKANSFHPDRLPMEICSKCFSELKDYGGYKNKMNPLGINLSDVWYDIPPVRHKKYKARTEANELSVKLLDRIIEMASEPGDLIFDPFGGSGTTYIVSEIKNRKWEGIELGPLDDIETRFSRMNEESDLLNRYRKNYNSLFPLKIKEKRKQLGIWTDDSFK